MDNDQLNNGIINLEAWLDRNEVYDMDHYQAAIRIKHNKNVREGITLSDYMAEVALAMEISEDNAG